ncbi:hypothetical protein [Kribbella sp. NPDC048915]|uniref:hypothetical protein n=1 Tax=Kribbella sp. NPDC048915 TaxID=3155148 RepID=UPI0033D172FD
MKIKNSAAALLGLTVAAGGLAAQTTPASARTGEVPTYCQVAMMSTTDGGDHIRRNFQGVVPPGASPSGWGGKDLLPDNEARAVSAVGLQVGQDGVSQNRRQYVVLGTSLYLLTYTAESWNGDVVPGSVKRTPIGGGWGDVRYIESSRFNRNNTLVRQNAYALLGDTILRWTVSGETAFARKATYTGFSAVKTMALISQTATYDTFLATTRGGALYTIRIPLSGQPVVKVVRRGTWQGFESLVADDCGQKTGLIGIDHETGATFMYEFGHANGTATVIRGLGKVNRTITETLHARYYEDTTDYGQLSGE